MAPAQAKLPTADELADGVLSIRGAIEFSGMPRTFIYAGMQKGELRYFMRGRHRMIPRRCLVAWMQQSVLKPSAT